MKMIKLISKTCYLLSLTSFVYWLVKYDMTENHEPLYFVRTCMVIFVLTVFGTIFDSIYVQIKKRKIKEKHIATMIRNREYIENAIFQNRVNMDLNVF